MLSRRTALSLSLFAALTAGQAVAQSGLRQPQQGEPGLDPTLASGWLAQDVDRYGTALHNWREAVGFAPGQRWQAWSYSVTQRSSLGMLMANSRELEESRQMTLYGRYSLTNDWALSAETISRDASGLFKLQDFRIGVQRRF